MSCSARDAPNCCDNGGRAILPTSRYIGTDGKRLPSVTTIINSTWVKGEGLIAWANREGLAGRSHTEARDRAAEIGTAAHALILSTMGGVAATAPIDPEIRKPALVAAGHGIEWSTRHECVPLMCESPLFSDEMGYGGTPDWYGLLDGVPTLLDIKTSRDLHAEHWVQTAAYRALLESNGHDVAQVLLLQCRRDEGSAARAVRRSPEQQAVDLQAWLLCQQMYEIRSRVHK